MHLYRRVCNRYTALLLLIVALQVSKQRGRVLITLLSACDEKNEIPHWYFAYETVSAAKMCTYFSVDGLAVRSPRKIHVSLETFDWQVLIKLQKLVCSIYTNAFLWFFVIWALSSRWWSSGRVKRTRFMNSVKAPLVFKVSGHFRTPTSFCFHSYQYKKFSSRLIV